MDQDSDCQVINIGRFFFFFLSCFLSSAVCQDEIIEKWDTWEPIILVTLWFLKWGALKKLHVTVERDNRT